MSILGEVTSTLRTIEAELLASERGDVLDAAQLAERIRHVAELLSDEDGCWIGTADAKKLLGVDTESTVQAWISLGLLRSRTLPDGRIQVPLDDVLHRHAEREALLGIGGEDLAPEELQRLGDTRPGTTPWERASIDEQP